MSIFSEREDNRPDPDFEGMSWYEITEALDEYRRETELDEVEREMMHDMWLYENRGWFKDYNPYNGSY